MAALHVIVEARMMDEVETETGAILVIVIVVERLPAGRRRTEMHRLGEVVTKTTEVMRLLRQAQGDWAKEIVKALPMVAEVTIAEQILAGNLRIEAIGRLNPLV